MKVRFLLIAAFIGCTFGPSVDTCPGVCWSYTQTIEDGGMDGFFDHQCRNSSGQLINVNIPTSGDMTGQACVTNPVHLSMRAVIRDVNHNGDLVDSTTQEQTDYTNATNNISTDLGTECRIYLAGEGCAIGDPMGTQQEQDAWDAWNAICDDFLVDPSQTAMHDFTGCMGWDPPVESTLDNIEVSDPDECFSLDTGGGDDLGDPPIMCDGDGEAGEMADETGAPADFGDLANLISCSPATTCEISYELISNVAANFEIFHDEGILLTMVDINHGAIVGAQLSGLDNGEDSYDLLHTYLSMNNGDVVTHVNSVALDSPEDVLTVLDNLLGSGSWYVTVRRNGLGGWQTRNYYIHLPPSAP